MSIKKWCALALAALMILPAYSYAAPSSSGSSTSSLSEEEQHFVPVTISNGKVNSTSFATTVYRNQIGEMAIVQEAEEGYKLSLKIGTLSELDMVQVVKQEKTEEVLELGVGNVDLGQAGVPEDLKSSTAFSASEEANEYYLSTDEITLESYETDLDTGLLTIPIEDLETPIIVRTFSTTSNILRNQVVEMVTEDLFDTEEVSTEVTAWDKLWMGWAKDKANTAATRTGKRTDGTSTIFDTGFASQVQVQKQEDGRIKVVLGVNEVEGTTHIEKIEIAASRPSSSFDFTGKEKYLLNDYWANYNEVAIEDGTITLYYDSFEQMAMGTMFRITTTANVSSNAGKTEDKCKYNVASLYLVPRLEPNVKQEATFGDVTVTYWSKDYPEGNSEINVSTDLDSSGLLRSTLDSFVGFSKDCKVYTFTALKNGEVVDPFSPVTITIPVPDDWNLDRLFTIIYDGTSTAPSRPGKILDTENRTITMSYTNSHILNGSFIMYDAGAAEDLTLLTDGIYQVKVTIASKTDPFQTSMANESFATIPAYLEVKDGEVELFAEAGGVNFSGKFGYISNMFMGDIDSEDKEEVTYLDYQTTEDGKPIWETDGETYSAYNIKRIRTKLDNPIESGNYQYAYQVGFWVPIMDGMTGGNPGSGTGAQPAFLRVSDVTPVDENPLNYYSNTVAMVAVDDAQYYLSTTDGLSEEKETYITDAISRANTEIAGWGDNTASEEEIFAVRDILKTAVDSEPLKSGRYQIPFSDEADASDLRPAYVVIRDGKMTVQIEMADGSSMPDVEYRGEYGDFLTDAEVSEDGKKVTYVLPYTESSLLLRIDGKERVFALDFANAALVSTDLSALEAVLEEAKAKLETESVYTTSSLEALQAEVKKAESLLEDFDVEQTAVDAQKELVQTALDGLKERADLTELRAVLLNASKEAADKTYTEASRDDLLELITEIKEYIREEADVSIEAAAAYVKQLADMIDNLEAEPDDDDDDDDTNDAEDGTLESFIQDYRSWFKEEDFTEESWAEFEAALEAAENLGSDLSEKENQKAIEDLMEARDGLVYKTAASDELEELRTTLEEIQKAADENGSAGYIGYDAWAASMDAAGMAADGNSYISGNQVKLLRISVETQYAAMLEEDNTSGESTAFLLNYLDYIPSVELEDLEDLEGLEETLEADLEETLKDDLEETVANAAEESTEEATEESTEGETEESTEGVTEENTVKETESSTEEAAEENAGEETEDAAEETAADDTESETEDEPESEEETEAEEIAEEESEEEAEEISEAEEYEDDKAEAQSEKEPEDRSEAEESEVMALSISRRNVPLVMASMSSNEYEDGTYYVDYDLYKWDEDKLSMGNPALDYGTEPGRMILDDGTWTLYIRFNQMEYDGIIGELKAMKRMTNISANDDGLVYKTKNADYPASISDFPEVLGFVVDPDDEYIPVEVNVPVMTTGPIQPARLKVDWDSLEYINGSVDINSSMDLSELEAAVKSAKKLKKADYTSWSWKVVEENLEAAEDIKAYVPATQNMIDARTEALNAAVEALVKVAVSSDYAKLSDALLDAYIADETDYSQNAWMELERARTAAENLQDASDVTPGMIDMAIQDLEEAVSRTGGRRPSAGDDDDNSNTTTGLRYSTLNSLITLLEGYSGSDYTEASWKQLAAALNSAKEVLNAAKKGNATQSEIDDQVELLKDARSGLVSNTPVKTAVNLKYLNALISRAEEFLKLSSNYTDASVRRLKTEYDLAVTMTEDEDVTQEDVDEQKEALRTAINSLVADTGNSDSDSNNSSGNSNNNSGTSDDDKSGSDEDDGYYKVNVRLWHATLNKASMGDPAIVRTAYVHIDDGDITMRLQTKKMTTSGITTHLYEFYIYDDGDYEEADLVSTENSRWTYEFPLPNDNSTYYKCKVDPRVDVMGDDPVKARLKVDWKSLKEVDEDDWDDLEGDTDDDDDDSSSSSSSSRTSTVELSSGETGIKVKGNTGGPGVVLEVIRKESGTSEHAMTATALDGIVNQFVLYDVKLKSGNSYVQPSSSMTLSIPIPVGYDTSKLVMYRINEDGTKSELVGKANGSYFEAAVDHFSLFALAESNQVKTAAASSTGSANSGSSGSTKSTTTGTSRSSSSGSGSSGRSGSTNSSQGSRTGSLGSKTGNSGTSAAASVKQIVDGREIPYTGDTMPVKELAGIGMLAVLVCLGTVFPGKRREEEEMSADKNSRQMRKQGSF